MKKFLLMGLVAMMFATLTLAGCSPSDDKAPDADGAKVEDSTKTPVAPGTDSAGSESTSVGVDVTFKIGE